MDHQILEELASTTNKELCQTLNCDHDLSGDLLFAQFHSQFSFIVILDLFAIYYTLYHKVCYYKCQSHLQFQTEGKKSMLKMQNKKKST